MSNTSPAYGNDIVFLDTAGRLHIDEALMAELLIVGGLMITGSGLSLLRIKDCHVLNMLPALLVPPLWFLAMWLIH